MDSASNGFIAGSPFVTGHCSQGIDSLVIGPEGANLYQLNVSISFSGPSGTEFTLALFVNDVVQTKYILYSDVASADEMKSASLAGLIQLVSGDEPQATTVPDQSVLAGAQIWSHSPVPPQSSATPRRDRAPSAP